MVDRTSAGIFGSFFDLLAKNPTEENKEIAKQLLDDTCEYDFNMYQMCADESLIILGLAKLGIDPKYPENGEVVLYSNE